MKKKVSLHVLFVFERDSQDLSNEPLLRRIRNDAHVQIGRFEKNGQELAKARPHELGELLGRVEPLTARVNGHYRVVEIERNETNVETSNELDDLLS